MIKSPKHDLFYPEIELDCFNRFHLERNFYWFEKVLEKHIIKEFGDCDISGLQLKDPGPEEHVTELMDLVEDDRLSIDKFEHRNFVQFVLDKEGVKDIREGEQPMFMVPHFLQHFDFEDVHCHKILIWKVNYLSL